MSEFEQYVHHHVVVWVRKDLKGKHRDHCLCYSCEKFKPNQETNCGVAQENYKLCKIYNLTLPIYECPRFREGQPDLSALE